MGKTGCRLGFSPKPFHELPVPGEADVEPLDGHGSVEEEVRGQVHLGHAPLADFRDESITVTQDTLVEQGSFPQPVEFSSAGRKSTRITVTLSGAPRVRAASINLSSASCTPADCWIRDTISSSDMTSTNPSVHSNRYWASCRGARA